MHIDYAGPFLGHMFLILINAHSKWMDVYPVSTASSGITIDCLRKSFSNHGLPEMLVSDNAAYFVSTEFKEFMNKNGIRHVTSAPFHASSNGSSEQAAQTFKTIMKKAGEWSVACDSVAEKEKVCGDVSLDISVCSGMVDRDVVTVPVHLGSQNQPGTVERESLSLFPEVRRSQRTVQNPKHLEDFVS